MDLTDAERLLLDFEREWWQLPATKMSEIRARFGFSTSSYYRSLHLLIDRPDADGPGTGAHRQNSVSHTMLDGGIANHCSVTRSVSFDPCWFSDSGHSIFANRAAAVGGRHHRFATAGRSS